MRKHMAISCQKDDEDKLIRRLSDCASNLDQITDSIPFLVSCISSSSVLVSYVASNTICLLYDEAWITQKVKTEDAIKRYRQLLRSSLTFIHENCCQAMAFLQSDARRSSQSNVFYNSSQLPFKTCLSSTVGIYHFIFKRLRRHLDERSSCDELPWSGRIDAISFTEIASFLINILDRDDFSRWINTLLACSLKMCGRSQVLRVLLDIAKLTRYFGAMPESLLRQCKSLVSALYLEDIVENLGVYLIQSCDCNVSMRILQIFRIYFYSHGSPSCIISQHIITILFLFSGSYQTDFNTTLRALSDVTYTNFTSLTADLYFYKSNGWNREVLKMMTLTTLKVLIWFFRISQSRTSEDTNTISYVIKKIEELGVCSFKLLKDPLLYRYMFTLLSTSDVDIIDGSIDLQIVHQLDESNRDIDLPAYHAIRQRLIAIIPSPYLTFLNVIQFIAPDSTSFVELLMSNETRFLEYLIGFLRFLDSEDGWGELKKACGKQFAEGIVDVEVGDQVTEVICLLEELNEKIQSLHVSGLWPYDPTPLVRRLVNVLDRVVNKDQAVSYD